MDGPNLWAGTVRVSHIGQRRHLRDGAAEAPDRHRPDTEQVEALKRKARSMGVQLEVLPPELDTSGGLPLERRPSLLQAVEGVEQGRYAGIIVAYLSRLGRNVREQLRVWDRVEGAGGRIVIVEGDIDTSTPGGRFQRTVMLGIAEMELDLYAERFENLREWATAAGIWQRRQTPRGYTRDAQTRKLVPDANAERVCRAFRARAAGETLSKLARDLAMTPSGVRALLRNRVYLGELRVGVHVNPEAHPALITEDEWLAVQGATAARPPRSTRELALLAGLARCASCGHVMAPASSRKYHTYSCHRDHSAGPCPAPAAITRRMLEDHVEGIALHELARLEARAVDSAAGLEGVRVELREAERELSAYLEGVSAAGLTPAQYSKGARIRRDEIDRRRERLADTLARQPAPIDGDPVKLWETLDAKPRNQLLRSLIECVLVAPAGRGKRVPIGNRVRVVAHGADLARPYRGGGLPLPVKRIPLPDRDDPVVLGMELGEDALEGSRR